LAALSGPQPVSMVDAARTDPASYVAGWLLVFVLLCTVGIFVSSVVTGRAPKESWLDVAVGVSAIAASLFLVVGYRTAWLNRVLLSGVRVPGRLSRYTAVTHWTTVRVSYDWKGRTMERTVWLAGGKLSARLQDRTHAILAVHPEKPQTIVIADLYEPGPAA
jgi:hypothetical protein